jgi:hypothetical protein
MRYDEDDDTGFKWLFGAMPVALGLVFLWVALHPTPKTPPPKNELAFGCYTNGLAPSVLLDSHGMHILQKGFPIIPFRIEWQKTGFVLSTGRPIRASQLNGRYTYSLDPYGIGYLHFFHIVNGQTYGIIDETELSKFTMLAEDGIYLAYQRSAATACTAV